MQIENFINSILSSNTFIIHNERERQVWVIDPGDIKPILDWLLKNNKRLCGILITHAHFDHIYGIDFLYSKYPEVKIYASYYAKEGMQSAKTNGSYYTDNPFVVNCTHIIIVEDNDLIPLSERLHAKVIYTPGHNNDCLSFKIDQFIFTGDALIPGIKAHTKSKYSDKLKANDSINRIVNNCDKNTIICPGHGEVCYLKELDISNLYA